MVMEALRGRESEAGQSTKNDCSVRTVAQSAKCHVVGRRVRQKCRREAECLILPLLGVSGEGEILFFPLASL